MKIRSGFVSNSSSSSFTCGICNETVVGYDMGLSEADMFSCINGHTMCDSHKRQVPDLTIEEKRQFLIKNISSWYKGEEKQRKINEYNEMTEDEMEDDLSDLTGDKGESSVYCPICNFETIEDDEGVKYLMVKYGYTKESLAKEIKTTFTSYDDLIKYNTATNKK